MTGSGGRRGREANSVDKWIKATRKPYPFFPFFSYPLFILKYQVCKLSFIPLLSNEKISESALA